MISDKTYHLTGDDKVVSETDPKGVSLLMCEGGTIPDAIAAKYGLPVEFKAAKKPAENNQKAEKPAENKALTPEGAENKDAK